MVNWMRSRSPLLYTYHPFPKQQLMSTYYYPPKHHPWAAYMYLSEFRSIIEPYQASDALVVVEKS